MSKFAGSGKISNCDGASHRPIKEQIADTQEHIKRTKVRLTKLEGIMDNLGAMSNDFIYNDQHIAEMVGKTFMAIDETKYDLAIAKKRLKKLKNEKQ